MAPLMAVLGQAMAAQEAGQPERAAELALAAVPLVAAAVGDNELWCGGADLPEAAGQLSYMLVCCLLMTQRNGNTFNSGFLPPRHAALGVCPAAVSRHVRRCRHRPGWHAASRINASPHHMPSGRTHRLAVSYRSYLHDRRWNCARPASTPLLTSCSAVWAAATGSRRPPLRRLPLLRQARTPSLQAMVAQPHGCSRTRCQAS